ncbi:phosphoglucosamine mutase [bacterium]|nr:phosphoglucosamine mutase [bacterium]
MSQPIVSIAGLRGIVGTSFTPEIILPYVAAFADLVKPKRVVVGGDSRPSRAWAQPVVESILRSRGVDVISIGLVPTPTMGMAVRRYKAGGGIAITASHNPSEWNGLKFFHSKGEFLTPKHHEQLHALMKKPASPKGTAKIGSWREETDMAQYHLEQLLKALPQVTRRRRKLRIVIDCCNGAGTILAPLVATALGVKVDAIFDDPGRTFPRGAEPLPKNLRVLSREVKRIGADLGAAIDPDADRIAFVDETGRPIGEERTLILAADSYLSLTGEKTKLVANLSTSMGLDRLAEKYNTTVKRTKIGEAHVLAGIRAARAKIGGEGNGGVILPLVHPGRDAATALALILLGMQTRNKTLSKWNEVVTDYELVKGKVELGGLSVAETLKRAKAEFKDAVSVDETDGVKFLWDNAWVHLRPSGTEPILRIFVEAPTKADARKLVKRAGNAIA